MREEVEAAMRDRKRPATARHLYLFFRIVHCAVWAFLCPEMKPLMRLGAAWYAYYATKGWEAYARQRKNMSDDFLTVNQRDCIYANAHSLLLYMWWLADNEHLRQHVPFAPHLLGSQQCESMFRLVRSFCGDSNFTVVELLRRLSEACDFWLTQARRRDDFRWPAHRKHPVFQSMHRPPEFLPEQVNKASIDLTLENSRTAAIEDLKLVGIDVLQEPQPPPMVPNELDDAELDDDELVTLDDRLDVLISRRHVLEDPDDESEADNDERDINDAIDLGVYDLPDVAAAVAAAFPPIQPAADPLQQWQSERTDTIQRLKTSSKLADGFTHKQTACADVSGHIKVSSDRKIRVRQSRSASQNQQP
jgi:hypothetical protein